MAMRVLCECECWILTKEQIRMETTQVYVFRAVTRYRMKYHKRKIMKIP